MTPMFAHVEANESRKKFDKSPNGHPLKRSDSPKARHWSRPTPLDVTKRAGPRTPAACRFVPSHSDNLAAWLWDTQGRRRSEVSGFW